ncbi:MAG: PfkB family carbohydrate kinase [Thermoguttaceae bacterium]|nr:PfkB family carbohydrate kinase [Thermoguttaceae bacterium]
MNGKITGIGAHVYDTLIKVPDFPVEDTKCLVETVASSGGGPCATGLVAAAHLDAPTSWLGTLADDTGGKFLLADFVKHGVDTQHIVVQHGCRSFSSFVILNGRKASRTCLLDRGTLPPLQLNDDMRQEIVDADLIMIDGNEMSAALEGIQIARQNGTKVLYDAGGLYPNVEKLMPFVDILIPSEEFAIAFTRAADAAEAARRLFEEYHPEIVAVTQGARGGVFFDGQAGSWPAFQIDVTDSNGAGDVFHGAFAAATVAGQAHQDRCIFAAAVSAMKCTSLGARNGLPSTQQVRQFIKEKSCNEL